MSPPTDELATTLRAREERLLCPTVRASREAIAELLAEDYLEHGASGRAYDRSMVLDALPKTPAVPHWSITQFHVRALGEGRALVTYRLTDERKGVSVASLRCSIWERAEGTWRMVFHQGTAIPG